MSPADFWDDPGYYVVYVEFKQYVLELTSFSKYLPVYYFLESFLFKQREQVSRAAGKVSLKLKQC